MQFNHACIDILDWFNGNLQTACECMENGNNFVALLLQIGVTVDSEEKKLILSKLQEMIGTCLVYTVP